MNGVLEYFALARDKRRARKLLESYFPDFPTTLRENAKRYIDALAERGRGALDDFLKGKDSLSEDWIRKIASERGFDALTEHFREYGSRRI